MVDDHAWNIPLLEGEEPTKYGPKAKPSQVGQPVGRGWKGGKFKDGDKVADPNPSHGWKSQPTGLNNPIGAPPLDWWEIPWEAVCERIIRAMVPERVCNTCGEPRRRIVESERLINGQPTEEEQRRPSAKTEALAVSGGGIDTPLGYGRTFGTNRTTLGFSDCGHDDWRAGVVLDPFGTGVTAEAAEALGRDGIEIHARP